LLEDPYYIDRDTSASQQDDAKGDSASTGGAPGQPVRAVPGSDLPTSTDPAPEETAPEPTPDEPIDILMEPSPAPNAPTRDAGNLVSPEVPTGNDAGMPKPIAPLEPASAVDAGTPGPADSTAAPPASTCGNGALEETEACDATEMAGRSCYSQGFGGGLLQCTSTCTFDTSECLPGPTCERHVASKLGIVFDDTLQGLGNDSNSYSCSNGGSGSDVTLSWTAPSTGCFQLSLTPTNQTHHVVLALFDQCDLGEELDCDESSAGTYGFPSGGTGNSVPTFQLDAVANTSYAIVADAYTALDEGPIQVAIDPCVPAAWTCLDSRYAADQGCDCGCGALDPDCDDESLDACDNCGPPGSCSSANCYALSPARNWSCGP
jgi:hypothetical protein